MALTTLFQSLRISPERTEARCRAAYATLGDIPLRGEVADWVALPDGTPVASTWYIAERILAPHGLAEVELVARVPGVDWTWLDLRPIEHGGEDYPLVWFSSAPPWSNYPGGATILEATQRTWEIEFLDRVPHPKWLRRSSGVWPQGFSAVLELPQVGAYYCHELEIKAELDLDPLTGSEQRLYRHFATFRLAPQTTAGLQLVWGATSWGSD